METNTLMDDGPTFLFIQGKKEKHQWSSRSLPQALENFVSLHCISVNS